MIDTAYLPEAFQPLWEAFRAQVFSPRGKREAWHRLNVTVSVVDMEKALKEACRLNKKDIEVG